MKVFGAGPTPCEIMILGEAPGEQEVLLGKQFVGVSGQELDRLLAEVGIARNACYVTNVCKDRPPSNDISAYVSRAKKSPDPAWRAFRDGWISPEVHEGVELLKREMELCNPAVIIAFGNLALWALTGQWGIGDWRGSELRESLSNQPQPKAKVIPTYHPAAVLRQWTWRGAVSADLRRAVANKASREYTAPNWNFTIRPSFSRVIEYLRGVEEHLRAAPTRISFDLETRAGHIACAGLALNAREAIVIPFIEMGGHYWGEHEESAVLKLLHRCLTSPNARVIGQNLLFDCQYTWRHWLFVPRVAQDTMISWHTAFCELPKALDFQASMICKQYVWWKGDVVYDPLKKDS